MNFEMLIDQLMGGLKITLSVFILTLILSIPIGIIVAILRVKGNKLTKRIVDLYILIMRGTPLLLQIIFIFFGLPLVGVRFGRFTAAIVAFVLNYGAYFAEIFRAGIEGVDDGQLEACEMLGLSEFDVYIRVILPQAFKKVIPPIGNEVISLIKDTALVYIVGLQDILMVGKIATNREASLFPLVIVGILYLILVIVLTNVFKKLEKKYNYYK
ncbi:amino acid ABC transporter permease [Clostridium sardiniense]|uniref:Amino acid ABC transporter permease n=1 Tax=Clostridium sardiniense TaxID=29369 RepID=A0ABS7L086_CLOSR|nr:amino acid ABC transporter permease [Clostridium sardiniense]MBY0756439.1 amino acid ABC transporter permease [Clostridium sardiniense]